MINRKKIQKRRQHWLSKYKIIKGCSICGYNDYALALDFAHINPSEKSIEITKHGPCGSGIGKMYCRISIKDKMKNRQYLKELMDEIRKCKILCKNCHVKETFTNREMHNNWNTFQNRKKNVELISSLEGFFG
jgi:5-methylcytosine-specific restriction endonuclease McrA